MTSVCIRADSGSHIGTGHVMRCLTIARELATRQCQVIFACRNHAGNIIQLIQKEFAVVTLARPAHYPRPGECNTAVPHAHWLGVSEQEDATQTTEELQQLGIQPDWVIIDNFSIGAVWEQSVKQLLQCHVLVIDGLLDRSHYCDILIDPTLNLFNQHKYQHSHVQRVLTGPATIPLRSEFTQIAPRSRQIINTVMVCFGGVDATNMTLKICQALANEAAPGTALTRIDVVVGNEYPYLPQLQQFCASYADLFVLHVQTSNMAQLMQNADLAIGAGGTMAWERCATALPAIVVSIAYNQLMQNAELEHAGAVLHVGEENTDTASRVITALQHLIKTPALLRQMSEAALKIMHMQCRSYNWLDEVAGLKNE